MDPNDNANKLTIGTLTAQIAQIEMNRETSICSMNNIQSSKSSDIKIEKQRFCPSWSVNLKYESFKKQLENWCQKNKNDEPTKYYEVLEALKKNDKIPGLSDHVSGTVCNHLCVREKMSTNFGQKNVAVAAKYKNSARDINLLKSAYTAKMDNFSPFAQKWY